MHPHCLEDGGGHGTRNQEASESSGSQLTITREVGISVLKSQEQNLALNLIELQKWVLPLKSPVCMALNKGPVVPTQTSELRNHGVVNAHCFKPLDPWLFVPQAQKMNATFNKEQFSSFYNSQVETKCLTSFQTQSECDNYIMITKFIINNYQMYTIFYKALLIPYNCYMKNVHNSFQYLIVLMKSFLELEQLNI